MPDDTPRLLLTSQQAAKALALSERSLFDLAKSGELPRVLLPGGAIRYSITDIEAWIERHRQTEAA